MPLFNSMTVLVPATPKHTSVQFLEEEQQFGKEVLSNVQEIELSCDTVGFQILREQQESVMKEQSWPGVLVL